MIVYAATNFRTKKALREAIERGERIGLKPTNRYEAAEASKIGAYETHIEGPWFPEPHRWYAKVAIENGAIVRVVV